MNELKELPEGWEWVKLGEVGRIETGTTPSKAVSEYYGNDFPFFKPTDLSQGINCLTASDNLSKIGFEKSRKLPKNTVLVTCIGATIGKTGLSRIEGTTNQQINSIIPSAEYCSKYVFYQVLSPAFQKKIKDNASSTTLPLLNKSKFQEIKFVKTGLVTQQSIVSKIEELFSELDKGVENLKTAQQQLKLYRQAVLKWAFEGKLTNGINQEANDLSDEPDLGMVAEPGAVYQNIKKNQSSEALELPKGWRLLKISDAAELNPKIPNRELIPDDLEVQFLPMKLVEAISNNIHLEEIRLYKDVLKGSYTPFINGDIIFAKVTPCMENGKIAVVNKLKNNIGFGSSEFHVIRCSTRLNNSYAFYFLVQDFFRNHAANAMTGAVGLRRVPKQFIENFNIPVPPINEQIQIVEEIEKRLSVADKMEESIQQSLLQAESLRQSILKKAFDGGLVK